MAAIFSQSSTIMNVEDLLEKWPEIEQKLNKLFEFKLLSSKTQEINVIFDQFYSKIQLFQRISQSVASSEALSVSEEAIEKLRMFLFKCDFFQKDVNNEKIKELYGHPVQHTSLILIKYYTCALLINIVLKLECKIKCTNIEGLKTFHIFVMGFISTMTTDNYFIVLNAFKCLNNENTEFHIFSVIQKNFKYSLLKSIIYHMIEPNLLNLCEMLLFEIIKAAENLKNPMSLISDLLHIFFRTMNQNYMNNLYETIQNVNLNKQLLQHIQKIFFFFGDGELKEKVFESIKNEKIEDISDFFEILKPCCFINLIYYKPKPFFCYEKVTAEEHLLFSNEMYNEMIHYFEEKKAEFEKQISSIQANISALNQKELDALIKILSCFMLSEKFSDNLNYPLIDFLISLEKIYKLLIHNGSFQSSVNLIIGVLYEILLLKSNSNDIKFQETFKLFSIVAKDNSYEGLITLSKYLRILSFANVPPNFKNQIDNFFQNDLPQIFEKLILNKDPFIQYLGLLSMEIFSTSEKLENIDFLFQKQDILLQFTNFLKNEIIENVSCSQIKKECLEVLESIMSKKMAKQPINQSFFDDYLEEIEKNKKMEEIYDNLKKIVSSLRPKNINLLKKNIMNVFENCEIIGKTK